MSWLTLILPLPSLLRSELNLLSVTQNYKSRGQRSPGRAGFCVFEGTVQGDVFEKRKSSCPLTAVTWVRGENLIQELSKDCMSPSDQSFREF